MIDCCETMLVKFEIYNDGEYWCGRGIGDDIFTQETTLDELVSNMREAVQVHFDEELEKGEDIKDFFVERHLKRRFVRDSQEGKMIPGANHEGITCMKK